MSLRNPRNKILFVAMPSVALFFSSCGNAQHDGKIVNQESPYARNLKKEICAKMSGQEYCFPRRSIISTGSPKERVGFYLKIDDHSIVQDDCNAHSLKSVGEHGYVNKLLISEMHVNDTMDDLYNRIITGRSSWFGLSLYSSRFQGCSPISENNGIDLVCAGIIDNKYKFPEKIRYEVECNSRNSVINPICKYNVISSNLHIIISISRKCLPNITGIIVNLAKYAKNHSSSED